MLASGLRLLAGVGLATWAKGMEESECGKELVVGVLKFVEEAIAGRVTMTNVEPDVVFGSCPYCQGSAVVVQVLTFVLFPTHLIII